MPGSGQPTALAPRTGPMVDGPSTLATLQAWEEDLGGSLRRFPGELSLAEALAPARLLLGEDAAARRAWEGLLAQGDAAQRGEARWGLGAVALRAGLRASGEQDRAFAFDHALWHFDAVPADAPSFAAARFGRAVALIELGRYDAARQLILAVAADDPRWGSVLGTHLARREPIVVPPARPPP